MKIYKSITIDMETGAVIHSDSYEYCGPVLQACGATGAEKAQQTNENNVATMMSQDAQTIFGENQNILQGLQTSISPVVAAGPSQYGFSAPEDAAMRTQATQNITAAGTNASNAVRSAAASEGGGNAYLPSGSQEAVDAGLAENQAFQQSSAQLGVTNAGYAQGNKDYEQAVGQEAEAPAALENPATNAGAEASKAAGTAFEGTQQLQQIQNAWEGPVGGIIGDAVTAGLGA